MEGERFDTDKEVVLYRAACELINNGMAIGMDRRNLFFNPYSYSDKVISEMRRNIAMNRDIFTFDLFYDFVENLVERREK